MNGNDDKVLLDLNYPTFQDELFDLDAPEIKKIIKALKKIKGLAWNDLFRDHGLKWEELKLPPENIRYGFRSHTVLLLYAKAAGCDSRHSIKITTAPTGRNSNIPSLLVHRGLCV